MSDFLCLRESYGDFTTNVPYRICTHFRVNTCRGKKFFGARSASGVLRLRNCQNGKGILLFPRLMEFIIRNKQKRENIDTSFTQMYE